MTAHKNSDYDHNVDMGKYVEPLSAAMVKSTQFSESGRFKNVPFSRPQFSSQNSGRQITAFDSVVTHQNNFSNNLSPANQFSLSHSIDPNLVFGNKSNLGATVNDDMTA